MSKVIVTALILAIVSSISCQSCSFEANIDYFGNDLFTNFIYYATQDMCCAACAANPGIKLNIKIKLKINLF
jgi:hypothetical protein